MLCAPTGLRTVIGAIIVIVIAAMISVLATFRDATKLVDRIDQREQTALAANYLDHAARDLVAQQKVQLTWDEAFQAVGYGTNAAWSDTYLGEFLWTNVRLDGMFLVDPQGRLLRSWDRGKPGATGDYRAIAGQVAQQLRSPSKGWIIYGAHGEQPRRLGPLLWPFSTAGRPLTRYHSAMVSYRGEPALMTLVSILPDVEVNRLRAMPNHLVGVRRLDPPFLAEMGRAVLLDNLQHQHRSPQGQARLSLPLHSATGQPLGWLTWSHQPDSAIVRGRVRPMMIVFLVFMMAVLGCAAILIRRLLAAVRESEASKVRAQFTAGHDGMTGLPNRDYFLAALAGALAKRDPTDDDALVVVAYLDLDQFKMINDTMGHAAGDELIRVVAARLRANLPAEDLVARLGGDEFVVLAVGDRKGGRHLGLEIMAQFVEPYEIQGQMLEIKASCGLSWSPDTADTADELLRQADIALYSAKHRGGARWHGFTPIMAEAIHRRRTLETDLRQAIRGDKLTVVYQPIVQAHDGVPCSAEALVRWTHPTSGVMSPAQFIRVAEQAGLMNELGSWVIERVFFDMARLALSDVSINLSPLQVMARGFLPELEAQVRRWNIDPARVTFEITEGVLLDNSAHVLGVLGGLKAMGFHVALDDFGTGFSSLGYLRQFQFDRIKIDRTFVQNIENDLDALAVLRAIVSLGNTLRMTTVAEGVETPLQRQLVQAAGCQLIQGHLFWSAMSADDYARIIGIAPRTVSAVG